jgi:hypothetical protein
LNYFLNPGNIASLESDLEPIFQNFDIDHSELPEFATGNTVIELLTCTFQDTAG